MPPLFLASVKMWAVVRGKYVQSGVARGKTKPPQAIRMNHLRRLIIKRNAYIANTVWFG